MGSLFRAGQGLSFSCGTRKEGIMRQQDGGTDEVNERLVNLEDFALHLAQEIHKALGTIAREKAISPIAQSTLGTLLTEIEDLALRTWPDVKF